MTKSRRVRWAGHVAQMAEKRNAYRILMGKPEGKRPLGRARHRWVDIIKIDLRKIGWDGVDWIDLAQDRDQWRALVNMVMNVWVPQKAAAQLAVSQEELNSISNKADVVYFREVPWQFP
jgi:hypothetical protein